MWHRCVTQQLHIISLYTTKVRSRESKWHFHHTNHSIISTPAGVHVTLFNKWINNTLLQIHGSEYNREWNYGIDCEGYRFHCGQLKGRKKREASTQNHKRSLPEKPDYSHSQKFTSCLHVREPETNWLNKVDLYSKENCQISYAVRMKVVKACQSKRKITLYSSARGELLN